jgi:hypothetical protein
MSLRHVWWQAFACLTCIANGGLNGGVVVARRCLGERVDDQYQIVDLALEAGKVSPRCQASCDGWCQ